jgi:hypothetical protein
MKSINVSIDVFARIWSLHQDGEQSEDDILRRVLGTLTNASASKTLKRTLPVGGLRDVRHNVEFPEGFEVFRTYLGTEYRAKVIGGSWLLDGRNQPCTSLSELSKLIGAKTENAWINWYYFDDSGRRNPVSKLRSEDSISKRQDRNSRVTSQESLQSETLAKKVPIDENPKYENALSASSDGTWRDDVQAALRCLGGQAPLSQIYRSVKEIREKTRRSVPESLEATIRRTLEDHSSDSDNYRGTNLFAMPMGKGAGIWALR